MTRRLRSPAVRFAAFVLPAVVLPAAVLAVLGYQSLRQWERSAETLFQAQARDLASMTAEKQERISEKFYRIGRSETQERRGSGVALALVRHIVEAHGGRVTVESQPGRGSRFTLWIPLHAGDQARAEGTAAAGAAGRGDRGANPHRG